MAIAKKKIPMKASNSSPNAHPPYLQMITEAITSLKDRSGSSQPAIAKFIEAKYKESLPPNFKKILSVQLKKYVKSEKLFKINNSYKISANSQKDKTVKNGVEKTAKMKRLSQVKTPEALKKNVSTAAGKTDGKMKRLSQVKTPDRLKKTKAVTPMKQKSLKKGNK
ncbi:histone H1-like isoform X2 [Lycium barbarum]|uniref:histone H1-like isoform X2 n=1 Tax=Lycium barbarum TaxID=112863 RepID=UPI00293EDB28|nr:histone H1-like isoform X2 [Lycium barbarum]